ncbi:T9SS type A sorting domain-containing protein [Puia sp.]|jgi:hypothetical protein|uniref:T9SS type A sorting domain-containing protein n=1 Tax=Puia sp. TaxID=2045100 RepID=UPI002F400519
MKKFYSFICAAFLLSLTASAQFSATYTAVRPGNWVATGGATDPTIWLSGPPPTVCNNCLVNLAVPGGGVINMNGQLVLNSGSSLVIGPGVTLKFNPSTATSFSDQNNPPYSIGLNDIGHNTITWSDATSTIDATALGTGGSNVGKFDGVFTVTTITTNVDYVFLKEIGRDPLQFHNDLVVNSSASVLGLTFSGPNTLDNLGTLPILLSSFTASLDQDVVDLAWTTTLEINADHIAIQRSVDAGAHWTTIATEAAKNTTGLPTNYTYADTKPAAGTSEYRLQLVDKDGKYTYSQVKVIRNGLIGTVSVFPNPAHDVVNVTVGGKSTESVLVRLYNQTGQLVQMKNVANAGGTTVALGVSGYAAGSYTIVVNGADGARQVSTVLITK